MTVVARFRFDPEKAEAFCWEKGTSIVELQFDNPEEVIAYCEAYEDAIIDVIALINGQVVAISDMPETDDEELHV